MTKNQNLYENRILGPNHQDWCVGTGARYSGEGYNRVIVCPCGAEDHAPDFKNLRQDLFKRYDGDF